MLKGICTILTVTGASHKYVIEAIEADEFKDFEDCLQDKCAVTVQANYIVTRNTDDFKTSQTKVVTPTESAICLRKNWAVSKVILRITNDAALLSYMYGSIICINLLERNACQNDMHCKDSEHALTFHNTHRIPSRHYLQKLLKNVNKYDIISTKDYIACNAFLFLRPKKTNFIIIE